MGQMHSPLSEFTLKYIATSDMNVMSAMSAKQMFDMDTLMALDFGRVLRFRVRLRGYSQLTSPPTFSGGIRRAASRSTW